MKLTFGQYVIRTLAKKDLNSIKALCEKCCDYYELVEGSFSADGCAIDILEALPPDKEYKDKFALGVFNDDRLIGAIDFIRDYPVIGEWIIGLLIIEPKYREAGLGRKINTVLAEWARELGAEKLRIGVAEQNVSAYKFWSRIGYYEISRTKPIKIGNNKSIFIVMNYKV